jgi:hypothetical protein
VSETNWVTPHIVTSWREYSDPAEFLRRLKNVLATELNKFFETPGKRWFVRVGSKKPVNYRKHLDYLLDEYLPDHPGVFWKEGMPLPQIHRGLPPRG